MKKLLLLLLCVPLIGFGQSECNTEEEVSLLIQLDICIDDYSEDYDGYLDPCFEDCYIVHRIQEEYILISSDGYTSVGLNCGSTGCEIVLFKKVQDRYEEIFSFYGYLDWAIDDNSPFKIDGKSVEIILVDKGYWDGGDEDYWEEEEYTYYKLIIINDIVETKVIRELRLKDGNIFLEECWDEEGNKIDCE